METRVLPYSDESIAEAARLILAGGPVAVPTETVYGLAADATNPEAVARIYDAKGRPSFNPLIVHVLNVDEAKSQCVRFNDIAQDLADIYWPGPLTLVLPICPMTHLAQSLTAGLGTVGVRSPAHEAMRRLIAATGKPLAAPSANASGSISPTRAEHVLRSLGGRIPLILDGGPTARGLESTIIKVHDDAVSVLRRGPVDGDAISVFAKLKFTARTQQRIESPGQLASHYAPSKPLRLHALSADTDEYLIGFGEVAGDSSLSRSGNLVEAASLLFDLLHRADASTKLRIAVAPVPDEGLGAAINDRLRRAAAGQ